MSSTTYLSSSDSGRPTFGRRASGFLLALAAEILIILALLWLSPTVTSQKRKPEKPLSFSLSPGPRAAGKQAQRPKSAKAKRAVQETAPIKPTATPAPIPAAKPTWLVAKEDFEASNIANIPRKKKDEEPKKESVAAYGPGEGRGGEQLYRAEWYREPTAAEMSPYMPKNVPPVGSWAVIDCKTLPRYHVEDCRQISEHPVGLGLGRALRLASWQFLVRPERVNGQAKIGSRVSVIWYFNEPRPKRESDTPEDEGSQ